MLIPARKPPCQGDLSARCCEIPISLKMAGVLSANAWLQHLTSSLPAIQLETSVQKSDVAEN